MVRFTPDTWRDAIWRPLAMAAPDGNVYIEIMAPDVRFACLMLLTLAIAVLAVLMRRKLLPLPALLLLVFTWAAFIPWLATTGNGRYFIPVLVLAGPLCIALVHKLPGTAALRLVLAGTVVALQGFVLVQNDPRGWWPLAPWRASYFQIELTDEDRHQPAVYALVSSISYSLLAPQFDERSRWIGLSSLPMDGTMQHPDGQRAQAALARARADGLPIKLLVPTHPGRVTPDSQPDEPLREEINRLLAPHRLALEATARCGLRKSATMAARVLAKPNEHTPELVRQIGFWVCPLVWPADTSPAAARPPAIPPELLARAERVFAVMERQCPRFFPQGAATIRVEGAIERRYISDMKAYVTDEGHVYFRYWRALNANDLGTADEVLAERFTMDCNQIRGRSGLPWERKL